MKPSLEMIQKDLTLLRKYEVVIFGSYASKHFTKRSDIDIAVITRTSNSAKNTKIWERLLRKTKLPYHLNIFELLPLQLKAEVMDNYIVVFGDRLDISEYFYFFRKLWDDCKGRYYANQFSSIKEKMRKLQAATM